MTTIIRATRPAEFLGLVPALAGFTPRRSLVLLPFHGSRAHGAMRIDLPGAETDPSAFADAAVHTLLQVDAVDAVAIVVYTDDAAEPSPDGATLPHRALAESLLTVADDLGLPVIEALCVMPDCWADFRSERASVASLDEIPAPPPVPGIGDLSGDQLTGAALPPGDAERHEQVERAWTALQAAMTRRLRGHAAGDGSGDDPSALAVAETVLDDLPAFFEAVLERPSGDDPYVCAAVLWCLDRPALRDAALVQWATDEPFGQVALAAQLDFSETGTAVPDVVGDIFLGRGPRPDIDRLGCALQVVRAAAALAPRDVQAGALTAAGWLAWAMGRSSHAGAYIDEALRVDPHHSMASLISTMLSAALLPEWALRPPGA